MNNSSIIKNIVIVILSVFLFKSELSAEKYGQEKIDSLVNELSKSNLHDTTKCQIYNQIAFDYYSISPELGIQYAVKALELSQNANFKAGIARAHNVLGVNYWAKNIYDVSLENYFKSLKIYEELGKNEHITRTYNNIGILYLDQKNFDKALYYFNLALEYLRNYNLDSERSIIYGNIGNYYSETKDFSKAKEYLQKALEIDLKYNDKKGLCITYRFMAFDFLQQKKYDIALEYFNKSLKLSREVDFKPSIINNLIDISDLYLKLIKDSANYKISYSEKIRLINEIVAHSEESKKLMESLKDRKSMMNIYANLANAYAEIKDWEKGFKYTNLYRDLKDSIFNQESKLKIANLEAQREIELNAKNYELKIKEKDYRNLILFISSSLSAIIAIAFIFVYVKTKKSNKILNKQNQLIQEKNSQVEILNENLMIREKELLETNLTKDKFLSIISHDLKTPISSFYNLSELVCQYYDELNDDEKKTHLRSLKNSSKNVLKLLENLLAWSKIQNKNVKAHPEIFSLKKAVEDEIEILRESALLKNIEIDFIADRDISVFADLDMIKSVIRNLISNAIKFSNKDNMLIVELNKKNEFAEVAVRDNGIGIREEDKEKLFRIDVKFSTFGTSNEKGTGLGLHLCKEFVEINQGSLGFESVFGSGSNFFFSLPIAEFD